MNMQKYKTAMILKKMQKKMKKIIQMKAKMILKNQKTPKKKQSKKK